MISVNNIRQIHFNSGWLVPNDKFTYWTGLALAFGLFFSFGIIGLFLGKQMIIGAGLALSVTCLVALVVGYIFKNERSKVVFTLWLVGGLIGVYGMGVIIPNRASSVMFTDPWLDGMIGFIIGLLSVMITSTIANLANVSTIVYVPKR
ncbi:hypothetical protein KKG41_00050 [Patescibacteria group bacterium]|nr:hypothetical protein [Patescibacteria group bacterium]MBU1890183.1 hypothetical protein [Patescibacteria group bacterium]